MPELPEVEVTRLSFADRIQGAKIQNVTLGKPLRWPLGCNTDQLRGLKVKCVTRRGKYLLIELSHSILILHLGLSVSLRFEGTKSLVTEKSHDHFVMQTDLGTLTLNDPRRFGAVVYADDFNSPMFHKLLGKLGVEPLTDSFSPELLYRALRGRHLSIKQALLGGQIVVGVGNIYASEALFLAKIRPTRSSSSITKVQSQRLFEAIRSVLTRAIEVGGSTLQNFSNAMGESGYFQLESYVYARAGEPCKACNTKIKQVVQAQRSTFYCPICQR